MGKSPTLWHLKFSGWKFWYTLLWMWELHMSLGQLILRRATALSDWTIECDQTWLVLLQKELWSREKFLDLCLCNFHITFIATFYVWFFFSFSHIPLVRFYAHSWHFLLRQPWNMDYLASLNPAPFYLQVVVIESKLLYILFL